MSVMRPLRCTKLSLQFPAALLKVLWLFWNARNYLKKKTPGWNNGMQILSSSESAVHYKCSSMFPHVVLNHLHPRSGPVVSCHLTPSQTSSPAKDMTKSSSANFSAARHPIFPSSLWLILPNLMHEREQKKEKKTNHGSAPKKSTRFGLALL